MEFPPENFESMLEEIRTISDFAHLYCFLRGPVPAGPHCDNCCPCFKEGGTPCASCRERMDGEVETL
jgi:hypothetical protein